MTDTDWRAFSVFLAGCLIATEFEWVERLARERAGTPEGELLSRELAFHRREEAVGFAQAMEETMDTESLESAA